MTIIVAIILVILVIFIFLQDWRATIVPVIAIPVSLVGTFAIMAGIAGSFTVLLGKCFSEVVQSAYLPGDLPRLRTQARHDVVAWQLWIFAFGAAFAACPKAV